MKREIDLENSLRQSLLDDSPYMSIMVNRDCRVIEYDIKGYELIRNNAPETEVDKFYFPHLLIGTNKDLFDVYWNSVQSGSKQEIEVEIGSLTYVLIMHPRYNDMVFKGANIYLSLKSTHLDAVKSTSIDEFTLRKVVTALNEGVVVHERDGRIRSCNNAALRILGLTYNQLVGKSPIDKVWRTIKENGDPFPGDQHPASITLTTEKPQHKVVMGVYREDNSLVWILINSEPIFDNYGFMEAVAVSFSDVTTLKLHEKEINKLAVVARNTTNCVIITNRKSEIEWVNDSFTRITGYSFEEVKGKNPKLLQGPESNPHTVEQLSVAIRSGKEIKTELINYHKDGHKLWIELDIQPLRNSENEVTGFVGLQKDITERKLFEQELVQKNRTLGKINAELDQFVYRVSHDLRGPLSSNLGLIGLMKTEEMNPTLQNYIDLLYTSSLKLDKLIGSIFSYSNNSRQELNIQQVNFENILSGVLYNHYPAIRSGKIQIEKEIDPGLSIYSDIHSIDSILLNLINNAVTYHKKTSTKRWVKVKVIPTEDGCCICVTDNGIGIKEQYREKIFEMFFRGTELSQGSGLGLYIVQEVVEKLGGRIELHSEEDEGSSFRVFVPNLKQNPY